MIDVRQAINLIHTNFQNNFEQDITLRNSTNHLLTQDLFSDRDYPPFNRVMMDGIAIKFSAIKNNINEFKISGISPAGASQLSLDNEYECIEVMTGTILPKNADLVIPYEEVTIKDDLALIDLRLSYQDKQNIHFMGSDIKKGDLILGRDTQLNGPHLGIAASIGSHEIKVKKDLHINIISTGDELVDIDVTPQDFQIRRSNSWAMRASLQLFGYNKIELSHIKDDQNSIEEHFRSASKKFDILIYSGGVSKGKYDFLPEFWEANGVSKIFHGVAQRPGKPLWFGIDSINQTTIFGMPGNPVSSLVCLHRYFLNKKEIYVELAEEISFKKDLTYFVPVKIEYTKEAKILAHPLKIKNSGEFSALANSDGFIELPSDKEIFSKGECFKYFSWSPII